MASLHASDTSSYAFWSSPQLDSIENKLHLRLDEPGKGAAESLLNSPRLSAIMAYREGMPPQAEIHQKLGDFAVVRDADAAVLIGGKLVGGKLSAPNEMRTIEGGTVKNSKSGDIIYIPWRSTSVANSARPADVPRTVQAPTESWLDGPDPFRVLERNAASGSG
jgi:hypothetical protein